MIYLDTHIVVWLYAGLLEKFSQSIQAILNENEILISPIVRLELEYLYEIERVQEPAHVLVADWPASLQEGFQCHCQSSHQTNLDARSFRSPDRSQRGTQ